MWPLLAAGNGAGVVGAAARAAVGLAAPGELPAVQRRAGARALHAVQGAARRVPAADQPGADVRPARAHGALAACAHGHRDHATGASCSPSLHHRMLVTVFAQNQRTSRWGLLLTSIRTVMDVIEQSNNKCEAQAAGKTGTGH